MADYVPKLGQLPGPEDRRDAIHIAVIPVVAGQMLFPGSIVKVRDSVAIAALGESDAHGVVDPFLGDVVRKGQTFWLLLKPGSITGLRHVWHHPDFVPAAPKVADNE